MSGEKTSLPSVFLHEGQKYTQAKLFRLLEVDESRGMRILKRLKEYGILKTVKDKNDTVDLVELSEAEIELAEVKEGDGARLYISCFVGVIMVEDRVLKCYPKYLLDMPGKDTDEYAEAVDYTDNHLKQVLKVLERFNSKEQIIHMQNESLQESSFNLLAVMLYLLQDYFEYGLYTNTQEIIESNGNGEILWDKTINETFTLISNNRPYYPELLTRKRVTNDYDYFRRLHACVLTECSDLLEKASLDKMFGIDTVNLSTETHEVFGDDEYILHRIMMELNVQYNTHKQLLLKTLYAYIAHGGVQSQKTGLSMYGTNSFHVVWEKVCAAVLGNQLDMPLKSLGLRDENVPSGYDENKKLIELIDKPIWYGYKNNNRNQTFSKAATDTLIPDIVRIDYYNSKPYFMIYDAKYYNITLSPDVLNKQPGIESITKQYLYQLAYHNFIEVTGINEVRNCFILPTGETVEDGVIDKGYVELGFLKQLELFKKPWFNRIEVRLLQAEKVYQYYLDGQVINVNNESFNLKLYDTCELVKTKTFCEKNVGVSGSANAAVDNLMF